MEILICGDMNARCGNLVDYFEDEDKYIYCCFFLCFAMASLVNQIFLLLFLLDADFGMYFLI